MLANTVSVFAGLCVNLPWPAREDKRAPFQRETSRHPDISSRCECPQRIARRLSPGGGRERDPILLCQRCVDWRAVSGALLDLAEAPALSPSGRLHRRMLDLAPTRGVLRSTGEAIKRIEATYRFTPAPGGASPEV